MTKKNVNLIFKSTGLPENFLSAIASADENDLRLMLAVALKAESDRIDYSSLAEALGLSESEADASIKYWCGAGLLKKGSDKTASAKKTVSHTQNADSTENSAHKDGKLERGSELPSYSSTELSELIEKRKITAEFIDEAQRIVGKVFNTHEVGILVGIVDYIGFDEHSAIIILSHMVKEEKKSLRYAEKLAFSLYDMGITTADGLLEYFLRLEENQKTINLVRSMFGMSGRALTPNESRFLNTWITKMEYGVDVIRMAYDITVDKTGAPTPAYANAILKKWHGEGLRTPDDVLRYEEKHKKPAIDGNNGTKGSDNGASFDTDGFFDAAIKRAFDEL